MPGTEIRDGISDFVSVQFQSRHRGNYASRPPCVISGSYSVERKTRLMEDVNGNERRDGKTGLIVDRLYRYLCIFLRDYRRKSCRRKPGRFIVSFPIVPTLCAFESEVIASEES